MLKKSDTMLKKIIINCFLVLATLPVTLALELPTFIQEHKAVSIVVIVFALSIFYFSGRDTANKHFKKAEILHKKAENYYNDYDVELAEDYYSASNYHREKARKLEEEF